MWLHYVQTKEEQMKILHGCHVDSTRKDSLWKGMYRDVQELVNVYSLSVAAILFRGQSP